MATGQAGLAETLPGEEGRWRSWGRTWVGALLGGGLTALLMILAFPRGGIPQAAYVALVPLLTWFYFAQPTGRWVRWTCFVSGLAQWLVLLWWLRHFPVQVGLSPLWGYLGLVLLAAVLALFFMAWGMVAASGMARYGRETLGGRLLLLFGLAGVTAVLGFCQTPLHDFLVRGLGLEGTAEGHHGWLPFVAGGLAVVAIGQAWVEFGRKRASQIGWVERVPTLARLFGERWYLDRFYRQFLDRFIYGTVSRLFTANDRRVIDGALDGLGLSTIELGRIMERLHQAMIQYRLVVMVATVVGLVLFIGWGG